MPSKPANSKIKTPDATCNIFSIKLSESETSFVNKRLNFCPTMKEPMKEQL